MAGSFSGIVFWLVTNLRDRTNGCASREESEEVQPSDDVDEMQALIQRPVMRSHCNQRLQNCRIELSKHSADCVSCC